MPFEQMTPLERVAATLSHREADRVPVYPLLNGASRRLVGASYKDWAQDAELTAEAYERVTKEFALDCAVTLTDLSVEAADFGQQLVYPDNDAAHPDFHNHLIKDSAGFSRLEPINPRKTRRMSTHIALCDKLMKRIGSHTPVVAFVFGPLGVASMLRGQAELYLDIMDDPDAVHAGLRAITDTLLQLCDALMETGVHAVMLDTLFSSQSIMSKAMWRDMEAPYVRELAERIHQKGCMVMIHNCGKGIYFDAQIEAMKPEAISFLHLPDDCRTGEELKSRYGHKTTLIGHVDPTWCVAASDEEVRAECRRQLDLYKKGGGYVLATGCEYPASADFRAARILVEMARSYGKYA